MTRKAATEAILEQEPWRLVRQHLRFRLVSEAVEFPTVGCLSSHFPLDIHLIVKGLAMKQQNYMPVKTTQSAMSWLHKMSDCSVVSHPEKAIFVPYKRRRVDRGNIYNVAEELMVTVQEL